MEEQKKYFNAFNVTGLFGPQRFKKLTEAYPCLKEAWDGDLNRLKEYGFKDKLIRQIRKKIENINPDREFEKLLKENIEIIILGEKKYPKLLSRIYDPPAILYIKGDINYNDNSIAIVGTRRCSYYGKEAVSNICGGLANAGLAIISGLAKGIDSLAHKTAVDHNGRTIAVLGTGVDNKSIYPRENARLAVQIIKNQGALVSEFPLGTKPLRHHFPLRNRIISGISRGTIVIEAAERSGALITAYQALEQNRDVFAVPGPINSRTSLGTNKLIRMGARLIASSSDVLEDLNIPFTKQETEIKGSNEEENKIIEILNKKPTHIDKIIFTSNLNPNNIRAAVSIMEINGIIKDLGGKVYALIK